MKIFGLTITTKNVDAVIDELNVTVDDLQEENADLSLTVKELEGELTQMQEKYPLDLGQTVYDVALKNAQGRYTKTKPSLEHCTITEVVVDEKNYFKLVKRMANEDVFVSEASAKAYLESICK
jgi:hypothetical protein